MVRTSGRILRSEDVIIDGQYHLDRGQYEIDRDEAQPKAAVSVPTRVCILEDYPEYAVLEVTCACGAKICLRCEYAISKTREDSHAPDSTTVESEQIN